MKINLKKTASQNLKTNLLPRKPKIVLGISGGISAYKIPETIRLLSYLGVEVIPVITESAKHFVTVQTLQTVAQSSVYETLFDSDPHIRHLSLLKDVDALVVAPATANCVAKFAHGIADDLLSTLFLSFAGPKLIVPAMHTQMWEASATQRNIQTLQKDGVHCLGPISGSLACNDSGLGRMVDPQMIAWAVAFLRYPLNLKGKRIVVTAGGTTEAMDDVRVITNLSTGKWGHCVARLAAFWGAKVHLITTRSLEFEDPNIEKVTEVKTVTDLQKAVQAATKNADMLYMMAAVSDFTVKKASEKMKRSSSKTLELIPTPDILSSLVKSKKCTVVGFCLESQARLEASAKQKLQAKGADFMVANAIETLGQDVRSFLVLSKTAKPRDYKSLALVEAASVLLSL